MSGDATYTPLDLDAVLTRYYDADPYAGTGVIAALDDIPDLVAEVRAAVDLRERLAAAIEAEEPALFGSPEDQYQRGWSQMRGKAARIVRERP